MMNREEFQDLIQQLQWQEYVRQQKMIAEVRETANTHYLLQQHPELAPWVHELNDEEYEAYLQGFYSDY
jgi:hypothetical protein